MPIDPRLVKWDDEQSTPKIDTRMVKWDSNTDQPQLSSADRFIKGLRDPIDAGAQMLVNALPSGVVEAGNRLNNLIAEKTGLVGALPAGGVDQQVREGEKAYQDQRKAQGEDGIDWMRMGGNVLNPANLSIASRIPAGVTALGRLASGVVSGGALGAMAPVSDGDFATEKGKQVAISAALGPLVPAVTGAVSRLVSPNASTNPSLQLLKSEGVNPTLGQTLGGRWNALEEKLQSLPLMGDMIANARNGSRQEFNTAAINRSLTPIGEKVEGAGQDAVKTAGDKISAFYEQAKNQLGHFQLDAQGTAELQNLRAMAQNLPDKEKKVFENAWNLLQNELSPNGSLLSDSFKRLDSKLGKDAERFSGSSDAYQQQVGDALKEMQRALFDNAKRANPDAAKMLNAADAAWANLVRVEGASKAALQSGGVFTPGQLNSAIRQADTSVRDRATARGTALMQDLAGAGQEVIGNKVPNSFTADRMMYGGGALASGMINPAIPMALAGGAAAYTSPVQKMLTGLLANRPDLAQPVAGYIRKSAPLLAPVVQQPVGLLN
jgi:hypothetical protein